MFKDLTNSLLLGASTDSIFRKKLYESIREQHINLTDYSDKEQKEILREFETSRVIANNIDRNPSLVQALLNKNYQLDQVSPIYVEQPTVYYDIFNEFNRVYTAVGLDFGKDPGRVTYKNKEITFDSYFDLIYENFLKQLIQRSPGANQYNKYRRKGNRFEIYKHIKIS